nr:fibroblast growth factor 8a [Nematostella vectensis]
MACTHIAAFFICLVWIATDGTTAGNSRNMEKKLKKFLDPIYVAGKKNSDTFSRPFERVTQLYSRNSLDHIRILKNRRVDAKGRDGDQYAKLIIESDGFGRVRIRGAETKFYLCMDKRRRLRARKRARNKKNCIFKDHFADNAFNEFESVKYEGHYIAFNRRGLQRAGNKTKSGMKSVQFLERPPSVRRRLYRGRKYRKDGKQKHKICLTIKKWKKW